MSRTDDRTDRERYLEDELENIRYQEQQRQEREYQEREERRRQWQRETEERHRQADTWHEALQKQAYLCRREANIYPDDEVNDFFVGSADACDFALEIWPQHEAAVAAEIRQLEDRIAHLRDSVRFTVAAAVAERSQDCAGWEDVASTLADPDADIDNWLNW